MSKPYPSRRELRLQRERQERAKLREAELQRWNEEVGQRDEELSQPAREVSATGTDDTAQTTHPESPLPGRRAAAQDSSEDTPDSQETAARRRRRADSAVTSTGMLPVISKPRGTSKQPTPRSRREARQLEARRAAQRRAEVERLQREQDGAAEQRNRRRATAPQTTPPPAPAVPVAPISQLVVTDDQDQVDVEITGTHDLSATEITDISGLDTIEIRRAELRAETERLTQEIIALGETNPNVIDPELLRRQKELAEKSQELQDLETAAIEIVEAENKELTAESQDQPPAAEPEEPVTSDHTETDETIPAAPVEEETSFPQARATAALPSQPDESQRDAGRRRRRTTEGPFVSGPFQVAADDEESETSGSETKPKPPLAEFIRAPLETEPKRDPREPLEASSAHGLDTLDAKDVEAPDRRLRVSAIVMFSIGLLALIIAIVLLIR